MGKILIGFGSLALLIFLIIWLWQRQPSGPTQAVLSKKTEAQNTQADASDNATAKPQDNLVLTSEKIRIKGKLNPNDYLVIASNPFNKVVKTESTGNFEIELVLEKGLNLINYTSVSADLKTINQDLLTYFTSADKKYKSVYAGSVKSLFDNLLTISTPNGEINARTSKSTDLTIPQTEDDLEIEESTSTALRNIRVGDYAISLGENSDQNTQISHNLTIIRQDKPQNNSKVISAQIASAPKQNNFSVKNLTDSKTIEMLITKNTIIESDTKNSTTTTPSPNTLKSSQITKDKNAIIIYQNIDDENIIDLIYLIP